MPAMRAMPSTSPFLAVPEAMSASVAGSISMRPLATAMRWVAGLAATSTMWAWPWASKWVRGLMGIIQGDGAFGMNVHDGRAS
jgi:hypothetical protein